MKIDNIFSGIINTLQKNLDIRARKHEVTISNIANADTPDYKAMELIVSQELSEAEPLRKNEGIVRTHALHFSANFNEDITIRTKRLDLSKEVTLRGDGNTVNMEKEMAELSENNLMYRATADILSKKLDGLIKAIQGGKRS